MLSTPSSNRVVIAAAGSLKTQMIIDEALGDPSRRVLITTYTNENLRQLCSRLAAQNSGLMPPHVTVMGWLTFVMNQCARPYQTAVLRDLHYMRSLNFEGKPHRGTKIADPHRYFFDSHHNLYREHASQFAVIANQQSDGLVIDRLGDIFDHIYIDEVQDMAGYDLDLLDSLLDSTIGVTAVGDPRQSIYSTTNERRNKKYRGSGIITWFEEHVDSCDMVERTFSVRCNQVICDFADSLFPRLPPTTSRNTDKTGHDGIFRIKRSDVMDYVEEHKPTVLRPMITSDTLGLLAVNFGVSKGSTYDRVLIFPTKPMLTYLKSNDPTKAGSRERFYVAVTRAKYSVAFVVPD